MYWTHLLIPQAMHPVLALPSSGMQGDAEGSNDGPEMAAFFSKEKSQKVS